MEYISDMISVEVNGCDMKYWFFQNSCNLLIYNSKPYSIKIPEITLSCSFVHPNENLICGAKGNLIYSFCFHQSSYELSFLRYEYMETRIISIQLINQLCYFLDSDGTMWKWLPRRNKKPYKMDDLPVKIISFGLSPEFRFFVGEDGSLWVEGHYDKNDGFVNILWLPGNSAPIHQIPGITDAFNVFCDSYYHVFLLCKNGKILTLFNTDIDTTPQDFFIKSTHFYEFCSFSNVLSIYSTSKNAFFLLQDGDVICMDSFDYSFRAATSVKCIRNFRNEVCFFDSERIELFGRSRPIEMNSFNDFITLGNNFLLLLDCNEIRAYNIKTKKTIVLDVSKIPLNTNTSKSAYK